MTNKGRRFCAPCFFTSDRGCLFKPTPAARCANYHRRGDTIGNDTMGNNGKRASGAKIGYRHRPRKFKAGLEGVDVTRTMRGELVFIPAPFGSHLPPMLKLVPRPRGLFQAEDY